MRKIKMKLNITKEERKGLKQTFKNFNRPKTDEEIFYDLCFCICAPQTTFKNNRKVINLLIQWDFYNRRMSYNTGNPDFYNIISICDKEELKRILKPTRFYKQKAKYLIEAKKKFPEILDRIRLFYSARRCYVLASQECRNWFVKNVKGLGMKASSHFLRNLGDIDLAIIDIHILKFLSQYKGYYDYPKTFTKRYYLELEEDFQTIAKVHKLTTAELDALIWKRYSKTKWEDFKY